MGSGDFSSLMREQKMGFYRRPKLKENGGNKIGNKRLLPLLVFALFVVVGVVGLLKSASFTNVYVWNYADVIDDSLPTDVDDELVVRVRGRLIIPVQTELSLLLTRKNRLPPRNSDLFPKLEEDHVKIVMYVHNRPHYLRVVVDSLSKVEGIGETLLIVSHDGYYEEMNSIVEKIKFCQVKQIFSPYSPHLFPRSFPGSSPGDCQEKGDSSGMNCSGSADQYGNHRSPKIVSLKHHWWWLMNTVWDGLEETKEHTGHIVFIEEDHFILPNAYRNIQLLTKLKQKKCPYCHAANLAPSDVKSKGEGGMMLIAEKIGNVGYAFNRTVWKKIHRRAKEFCTFDDYNWDITMWAMVYPSWEVPVYTLRGPRRSAAHFGKCGLHQGNDEPKGCIDDGKLEMEVEELDKVQNIKPEWEITIYEKQGGYQAGFKGWGGWGDKRDHQLCLDFASMYHVTDSLSIRNQIL